jgi:hypothetical protein
MTPSVRDSGRLRSGLREDRLLVLIPDSSVDLCYVLSYFVFRAAHKDNSGGLLPCAAKVPHDSGYIDPRWYAVARI